MNHPWALPVVLLVVSCSGGSATSGRNDCGTHCPDATPPPRDGQVGDRSPDVTDLGPSGGDAVPVPRIRFQLQPPRDSADYPYTPASPPALAPPPRSAVYLSASDSFDPEGQMIAIFWNVQDPIGRYLPVAPDAASSRVSFSPALVGPHVVTLEVIEVSGLRQIAQTSLTLQIAPRPCATDGFSPPCSDDLVVPEGAFRVGSSEAVGYPNEHPAHAAVVASFALDRYEVTVGRFRRFLDAYDGLTLPDGAGAHPLIPGSGWRDEWKAMLPASRDDFTFAISECGGRWTDQVGASEARPLGCVTWFEAFAFCIWEGKRLPTETEWEYAASGGDEQRTYPWGEAPPSVERATYGCLFDGQAPCSDADLPVGGSLPAGAGRWGQLDLAGSLWEWTLDVYAPYLDAVCDNCAQLNVTDGSGRVFRGGDFKFDDPSSLRAASRYAFNPAFPDQTRGFRCARTAPDAAR